MKKVFSIILAVLIFTSCTGQNKLDEKPSENTERTETKEKSQESDKTEEKVKTEENKEANSYVYPKGNVEVQYSENPDFKDQAKVSSDVIIGKVLSTGKARIHEGAKGIYTPYKIQTLQVLKKGKDDKIESIEQWGGSVTIRDFMKINTETYNKEHGYDKLSDQELDSKMVDFYSSVFLDLEEGKTYLFFLKDPGFEGLGKVIMMNGYSVLQLEGDLDLASQIEKFYDGLDKSKIVFKNIVLNESVKLEEIIEACR